MVLKPKPPRVLVHRFATEDGVESNNKTVKQSALARIEMIKKHIKV